MQNRRTLFGALAAGVAGFFGWRAFDGESDAAQARTFEVTKSAAEWKQQLNAQQYHVLREHGTEWAGSSSLNREKRKGVFSCAGCDLPLFSSDTKYESGTGWPSFWQPLPNAVETKTDRSLLMARTEVHCRRCGGHLGHVFNDGPRPTGQRFCMNGVAMNFAADRAA
ncbi:MAG: peptide-methionine (R)-S-oxide reductase MsrB [Pseudorhodoplanes sp.]